MFLRTDNEMVVNLDAERAGGVDDLPGYVNIGLAGVDVAAGMVVHQDQARRADFQRALDHFTRIDRRVIDGAFLLALVGEELQFLVEEQDVEFLMLLIADMDAAIIEQLRPAFDDRFVGRFSPLSSRSAGGFGGFDMLPPPLH